MYEALTKFIGLSLILVAAVFFARNGLANPYKYYVEYFLEFRIFLKLAASRSQYIVAWRD